ncbi:MAG: SGNH/GDSL hydrolase family protein [Tannerellaceae bacterium]|jgi:lysophospholipase L1-like esterase|nr:SGNH/GDSL hydrolase family protein [Tannerellaceae bacterium]
MRKISVSVLFCLVCLLVNAQWVWNNPLDATIPVIQNQGWTEEIGKTFTRLPPGAQNKVPKAVWELSRYSAGLAIHFYSNAPEIQVRYAVNASFGMNHMPATGVSGIDLYRINSDGVWNICSGNFDFGDAIIYHYKHIKKDRYHDYGYEYRLYLPLYNSVKWLEVGVPDGSSFEFIPVLSEKPIVVYGTSIVQGACATRPALAWTTIVERSLDYPLINLGFSGSAKLEKEVVAYISDIDASLYVLDCMPNLFEYDKEEVIKRIVDAVKQIRTKKATPVLLIEHAGNSNAQTDSVRFTSNSDINEASLYAYKLLQQENIPDIHYIYGDEFKMPADGWVDYVHFNDMGMSAQALTVEQKIREIIKMEKGTSTTTVPVTQRREPNNYEWKKRHYDVLALNKSNPPKSLIIGNSITHFWGGKPKGPRQNGINSWTKYMEPQGYRNLGYGWDRIENVLWRIYHGELEGYEAEKIILMIGTNNMKISTDNDIVDGLRFLLAAIYERQPKATIKVIGILPRRNNEQWVNEINKRIQQLVQEEGYIYQNAGNLLLDANGKIDESLFSDGLHPNEKGYTLLGAFISDFD